MNKRIVGYVLLAVLYIATFWLVPIFGMQNSWWIGVLLLHGAFGMSAGIAFTLLWAFN